jgi:hypothetical protein
MAREEPVEQGRTSVTNVEMSSGGRREANANLGIDVHEMMLTGEQRTQASPGVFLCTEN